MYSYILYNIFIRIVLFMKHLKFILILLKKYYYIVYTP